MKPDASNHNPSPHYLRGVLEQAGISQREAATMLGLSDRVIRYYLSDTSSPSHRPAPYVVQFAIECLADHPLLGK
ncbi:MULTISPECIES: helix-turn-helix domain-containing protein [Pseudomonas fluorescens group]|uniref:Helix-turn-helix domain-containing protein n=1 Tax=Pseudomonas proteolytica TaxID=219574 RepID=A0AAW5A9Y5_9PSED|nr:MULTISPECIES: helix-turn-helix transcriptional regulator [Pseudomonas fluorescens group]KAA8702450.1 helix-turn-helix transcriptional regulator [Pseudomonas proteolytica]MCF5057491.1 helix-turn-helix domain-containing protein [Pseudomonas proteolytica]MCF5101880.1 helix-turn-helix domain-containing protein [Pseudomonas proteolytica]NNA93105.1 helix-turn-helix transcriptional regulator [Pseudomonas gessardii]TWR76251.1 helix-turn-helix transcriptional regulator [Pseudomonas proteolytica]